MRFSLVILSFIWGLPYVHADQIDRKTRTTIIHNVCKLLLENYVYPGTARSMSNYLMSQEKGGGYNKIFDRVQLGDKLTSDLHSIYPDKHLFVEYNPAAEKEISQSFINDSNEEPDPFKSKKSENFGFRKIELLYGNIGYLNLERFWADPLFGKEIAKAAFTFLKYTSAIIIDLRTNGGGSPETVTMICSYFFAEKLHMNSMYDRTEGTTTQFWTIPDSTISEMWNKPLYILTSPRTFSAAEEFAYNLQTRKRAFVIGEATGGGAHNTLTAFAGYGFIIHIPYGKAINPATGTNWEKTGVVPDFIISADKALEYAEMKIFENLLTSTNDSNELFSLKWQYELLKAQNESIIIDTITLKKFAGVYGERTISYENGKLYYQRINKPKFELEPMTFTMMKPRGNNYFKVEFKREQTGVINKITIYYQDNRIEEAERI